MGDSAIVKFTFHGDVLDVVPGDGAVRVAIRQVCEGLGVDFSRQLRKLKEDPAATVDIMSTVAEDGRIREVACIDIRSLPLWLATIHPSKVKPEVRAKLVAYKRECAEVLADHFLGRRAGDILEESRGAAAAVPSLLQRIEDLEDTLTSLPKVVTDRPMLGIGAARRYILDPLREIARLKAAAIEKAGDAVVGKLRFLADRSLRAELGFSLAPAHTWANFPTARLGEACVAIARMRAEALVLLGVVNASKQLKLKQVQ
ncbi:phage antirepressor N-terminal domain-containing protein [Sorangium cellulosum]|uniref:phage antirepressor N-terminal domain-containing protein n=1 Tax=Sorangium TaxID=39643 RepID=UPI003D9C1777